MFFILTLLSCDVYMDGFNPGNQHAPLRQQVRQRAYDTELGKCIGNFVSKDLNGINEFERLFIILSESSSQDRDIIIREQGIWVNIFIEKMIHDLLKFTGSLEDFRQIFNRIEIYKDFLLEDTQVDYNSLCDHISTGIEKYRDIINMHYAAETLGAANAGISESQRKDLETKFYRIKYIVSFFIRNRPDILFSLNDFVKTICDVAIISDELGSPEIIKQLMAVVNHPRFTPVREVLGIEARFVRNADGTYSRSFYSEDNYRLYRSTLISETRLAGMRAIAPN